MASWSADKTKIVICPHCGTRGEVPSWYQPLDMPIKCHKCKKIFEIPKGKNKKEEE